MNSEEYQSIEILFWFKEKNEKSDVFIQHLFLRK